jgi:hypothetical protein
LTVCLCWRDRNQRVHFAADSRLSWRNTHTRVDIGPKVLRVDSRITGPANTTEDDFPSYAVQLGFACAGNALGALTLFDSLGHLLRKLQYGPMDPSMRSVAATVAKVFRAVAAHFTAALFADGQFLFAMGGHCPVENKTRVFYFTASPADGRIDVLVEEILLDSDVFVFGSGRQAVESRLETGIQPLLALKETIEDEDERSVGGFVQYGMFSPAEKEFRLYSVHDYVVDHQDRVIWTGHVFRGLPLYGAPPPGQEMGLVVAQSIILPFQDQIQRYLADGYQGRNLEDI